jgi:hypothetical protein
LLWHTIFLFLFSMGLEYFMCYTNDCTEKSVGTSGHVVFSGWQTPDEICSGDFFWDLSSFVVETQ